MFGNLRKSKSGSASHEVDVPKFEKVNWKKDKNMRKLYFWCAVLCIASANNGYDGQVCMMLNSSQQMDYWQNYFDEPTGSMLGLMNNAYNLGGIASFFFVPWLTDRFGRKIPIAIGCVIMVIGGLVSTFATSRGIYLAGRLILGFGNSPAQMCSPILLTEIAHPQHRGTITAIYNCLWNLGSLAVAWISWGTAQAPNDWSWRSITFLQIVPSLVQLAFLFWIPESPRWLIFKDRHAEALNTLSYYHANGDDQNATVQFEYHEIRDTLRIEAEAKQYGYMDFFRTKGNRWRLAIIVWIAVISQYSGNALFSNYMNLIYEGAGIVEQNQKMALTGGKTILDLSVAVYAATLVDKARDDHQVGRRPLFLTGTGGMVVCFVCWTITSAIYENSGDTNNAAGYAQLPFIWIFGIFYSMAWSGLLVAYVIEILPFKLRAKGLMIMNVIVQAVLAVGNQTNPIAWEDLPNHWNLTLFYTLWICVEFVAVYFLFVETKGPTLEEICRIFDGPEGVDAILTEVEKEMRAEHRDSIEKKHVVIHEEGGTEERRETRDV